MVSRYIISLYGVRNMADTFDVFIKPNEFDKLLFLIKDEYNIITDINSLKNYLNNHHSLDLQKLFISIPFDHAEDEYFISIKNVYYVKNIKKELVDYLNGNKFIHKNLINEIKEKYNELICEYEDENINSDNDNDEINDNN